MRDIKSNLLKVTNTLNKKNKEAQKYINTVNLTRKEYQKVFTENNKLKSVLEKLKPVKKYGCGEK